MLKKKKVVSTFYFLVQQVQPEESLKEKAEPRQEGKCFHFVLASIFI